MTVLADYGIHLPRSRPGWQGTACPECARIKRRPHDDSLGVEVFADGGTRWSCRRCGWKGYILPTDRRRPARALALRPALPATEQPHPAGLTAAAKRRLRDCRPLTKGCAVSRYLEGRGCALPPAGILQHPALPHPSGYVGPCMVAVITDTVTSVPVSLHQTWLAHDGNGKAPVDRPRLYWRGLPKLGVVRLWPDDVVTLGLCIAEGIETALTAARGFGMAWACLDAGNLAAFPVLDGIESLTIVADHDEAGLKAAEECGRRWLEADVGVRVWRAPEQGADLNDYARATV